MHAERVRAVRVSALAYSRIIQPLRTGIPSSATARRVHAQGTPVTPTLKDVVAVRST